VGSPSKIAIAVANAMAIADPVADLGAAGAANFAIAVIAITDPGAAGTDIAASASADRASAVGLRR
jgi:hypothetical protein